MMLWFIAVVPNRLRGIIVRPTGTLAQSVIMNCRQRAGNHRPAGDVLAARGIFSQNDGPGAVA